MINYDTLAVKLNDADDLYAHESQILIKQVGGVDYLFMLYMSNKITAVEWKNTARAKLKIFNLSTLAHIRTIDLFYPALTAGIQIHPDYEINAPRMYFYGDNTLRCFCPNTSTLFTRDVNISDSNPANWTAGNISIAQMTMKDAGGDDVTVDVTSANIQTHLNYIFGDAAANYASLMPMFRNGDIAKSGDNWYATLELSSERSHGLARPTLCITSADAGNTWTFGSPIGYTVDSRLQMVETSMFFIDTALHTVSRINNGYYHFSSADNGITWVQQSNLPWSSTSNGSKPCAINIGTSNVIALTLPSEVTGNTGRTTAALYSTSDFVNFSRAAKIVTPTYCHYFSLYYYNNHLYLTGTGGDETTDRNMIRFIRIY